MVLDFKKLFFASFMYLFLGYALGNVLVTGKTDWYETNVTDWNETISTTEVPINIVVNCEDIPDVQILPSTGGSVTIVIPDPTTEAKCSHSFGSSDWQSRKTFYRLYFDNLNGHTNLAVEYELNGVKHKTKVPSILSHEVLVFSAMFTVTWTRVLTAAEELSFRYQALERTLNEVKVFTEAARTITLDDLGGFRPNTLRTFYIIGDSQKSNHSVDIVLEKLVLDDRAGDMFAIGKAYGKDSSFSSTPAYMFTSTITKQVKLIVSAKDVFVAMSTVFSQGLDFNRRKVDFKLSYNMTGINVIKPSPTPVVTTARSLAEMQAVTLCFFELTEQDWTCSKFLDKHLKKFQENVAELAQNFAEEEKIELPTSGGIRPEQVVVECYFQKKGKNNDSNEDNYISVVITHPLDNEKPLFTYQQLTNFFKVNYAGRDLSRLIGYTVKPCQAYPDYWSWYFGSIGIFSLCVLLLMIMWYWSHKLFKNENDINKRDRVQIEYNGGQKYNEAYVPDTEEEPYMTSNFVAYDGETVPYDRQHSDSFTIDTQHAIISNHVKNASEGTYPNNSFDKSDFLFDPMKPSKQDVALPSIPGKPIDDEIIYEKIDEKLDDNIRIVPEGQRNNRSYTVISDEHSSSQL